MAEQASSKIQTKVWLSRECYNRLQLTLLDPMYGRAKYGSYSKLVEALLWGWLRQLEAGAGVGTPSEPFEPFEPTATNLNAEEGEGEKV